MTLPSDPAESTASGAIQRFRRWGALVVGLSVLGYVAYAVLRDLEATTEALAGFRWELYGPVLALTLLNYGLRYFKWHYLLGRLGVDLPHRANVWVFGSGLAMVISPGKAGELLKPWLVREITGTPMARTVPALITERVTDAIAILALTALGVGTYWAEQASTVVLLAALIAAGMALLSVEPLATATIRLFGRIPVAGRAAAKLEELYRAMRTCLSPLPLVVTVVASMLAWSAECVGYWLIFKGLGVDTSLGVSTFLYASATTLGAPSSGGLGISEGVLGEGAIRLIPSISAGQAVAAALLVRVATLWFGVALGALALLAIERVIQRERSARAAGPADEPLEG